MNLNSRFVVTYVVLLCLLVSALFIHDIDAKKPKKHKAPKPSPQAPPPSNGYDASPPPPPPADGPTPNSGGSKSTFDVTKYPSSKDGKFNSQFERAWSDACGQANSVVLVPTGDFPLDPITLDGEKCVGEMTFQVDGNIQAPTAVADWGAAENWVNFNEVKQFTLNGKGTFDGRAENWWDITGGSKKTLVRIGSGVGVTVTDLHFVRSPQAHLKFNDCNGVKASGINIKSPENSPNTDGIHISNSKQITISNSIIGCGDDCISIAEGCSGITVDSITCDPSHGISIGSLGKDGATVYVSNITVTNSKVRNSDNGVRIKSYKDGQGMASDITFKDIEVTDVKIGISIDQYYNSEGSLTGDGSSVDVKNIVFDHIYGTYTKSPLEMNCGPNKPCTEIKLRNIDLRPSPNSDGVKGPTCQNVYGTVDTPSDAVNNCLNKKPN